ncbi:MAG: hypothetical protein KDB80_11230 [Planctomycetes bacterium]|nr:hypothetical protein [Planctomycetota bacterium]
MYSKIDRLLSCSVLLLCGALAAQPPGPPPFGRRGGFDPLIGALDTDGDRSISGREIDGAVAALRALDRNGDGNLTIDELVPARGGPERGRGRPGSDRRGPPPGPPDGMLGAMLRTTPLMRALDKDGDGELFEDEVTDAVRSLRAADRNGDGELEGDEVAPERGGRPGGGFRRPGGGRSAGRRLEPSELDREDGAAELPDRATFEEFSYRGLEVMVDTHLAGLEFVKFQIEDAGSDRPLLYFMNTKTHRAHPMFMAKVGIGEHRDGQMRGVLVFRPMLEAPDGRPGLYTFEFEPNDAYAFDLVEESFELLQQHAPILRGKLAYNLLPRARQRYESERERYEARGLPVYDESERYADIAFLPLNRGETFGRLRRMGSDDRPGVRDVVLYESLPNEMPRVAGVITTVPQTPLSHVNLRAVQDDVPNAFVAGALDDPRVTELLDKYVAYRVTESGFELRAASAAEVEDHFTALRPECAQVPPRDLSVKEIRPFDRIGYADADAFGVKAANLASLRTFGLRADLTPQGFAVPFSFYDAFMRHNDFYAQARAMVGDAEFRADADTRAKRLKKFRKAIRKGELPPWVAAALDEVHGKFPVGASVRCRSSTNNEDLPGFSGAGLYDSFTHRPEEGHLGKSIKQVFASLWNFRAYEEREFYRIDHFAAAMGVALHVNESGERANGVAVTKDVVYQTAAEDRVYFYVNAQVGEELVTNPGADSVPEEILLAPRNPKSDRVVRRSPRLDGKPVLGAEHLLELRRALRVIHEKFAELYGRVDDPGFAMEVEFKVTDDRRLLIKQARPWVD